MKELNGSELASYIKVRQLKEVRTLRQNHKIFPKLAIVVANDSPVIDLYVRLKKSYAEDILVETDIHKVSVADAAATIQQLNEDDSVHGIIIQLPVSDESKTDELVGMVASRKDVDALGGASPYDPATPLAINWLLAGYGIDLKNKKILIIGNGRLVGAPLARMWVNSGYDVKVVDDTVQDLKAEALEADAIVTATGVPSLLTSEMIRPETVVVDAGTAAENGQIVGDVAAEVRERHDLTITPIRGGVGPLTVSALLDNVIRAARESISD